MTPSEMVTPSLANSVVGGLSSGNIKSNMQSMIETRRQQLKSDLSVTVIKGSTNSPGHKFE